MSQLRNFRLKYKRIQISFPRIFQKTFDYIRLAFKLKLEMIPCRRNVLCESENKLDKLIANYFTVQMMKQQTCWF